MKTLQYFPKRVMLLAMAPNGAVGLKGGLPWHIPAELALFKKLTMGCTLVVGHRTASTLPRLPGRCLLTVGRDSFRMPKQAIIIGGANTYERFFSSSLEFVVSIIQDPTVVADTYLKQDIQSFIRMGIQDRTLLPIRRHAEFVTYATKNVRDYLMETL